MLLIRFFRRSLGVAVEDSPNPRRPTSSAIRASRSRIAGVMVKGGVSIGLKR